MQRMMIADIFNDETDRKGIWKNTNMLATQAPGMPKNIHIAAM